jgi:hypothetical protein
VGERALPLRVDPIGRYLQVPQVTRLELERQAHAAELVRAEAAVAAAQVRAEGCHDGMHHATRRTGYALRFRFARWLCLRRLSACAGVGEREVSVPLSHASRSCVRACVACVFA